MELDRKQPRATTFAISFCAIIVVFLSGFGLLGCNKSGSSPVITSNRTNSPSPFTTLSWATPTLYTDNTTTIQPNDLMEYKIYLFDDSSNPVQTPLSLTARDQNTGELLTSVSLTALQSHFSLSSSITKTYYIRVTALTIDAESDLSSTLTYTLP